MTSKAAQTSGVCLAPRLLPKSHAGWNCDMLAAMAKDPLMRGVDVAIAALIIQRSNQNTKESAITDRRLAAERGRNRATFTEFRKRGIAAGYFDCIIGASGRATIYKWKDDRRHQIENMIMDQRIVDRGDEDKSEGTTRSNFSSLRRKLSTQAAARAKNTKGCGIPEVPRKYGTGTGSTVQKTTHCDSAERTAPTPSQCTENSARSAKKTKHLHSYTSPKDSLPEQGRVSMHAREAYGVASHDDWTAEDEQARFDEIAGRLEYDEGLPRPEAENQARILCGFDGKTESGRQGAGTALPTVTKRTPEEGNLNGRRQR